MVFLPQAGLSSFLEVFLISQNANIKSSQQLVKGIESRMPKAFFNF